MMPTPGTTPKKFIQILDEILFILKFYWNNAAFWITKKEPCANYTQLQRNFAANIKYSLIKMECKCEMTQSLNNKCLNIYFRNELWIRSSFSYSWIIVHFPLDYSGKPRFHTTQYRSIKIIYLWQTDIGVPPKKKSTHSQKI